jgi:hypothetical protein
MAFPFGGHPQFQEYLEWVRRELGCTYRSGMVMIDGKAETFVVIINPGNGRHVIYFAAMTEHLLSGAIAHLDRRLGIDSPFLKLTFDP